jgi:hypothetical protein
MIKPSYQTVTNAVECCRSSSSSAAAAAAAAAAELAGGPTVFAKW